jgi:hypothetical protein
MAYKEKEATNSGGIGELFKQLYRAQQSQAAEGMFGPPRHKATFDEGWRPPRSPESFIKDPSGLQRHYDTEFDLSTEEGTLGAEKFRGELQGLLGDDFGGWWEENYLPDRVPDRVMEQLGGVGRKLPRSTFPNLMSPDPNLKYRQVDPDWDRDFLDSFSPDPRIEEAGY